MQKRSETILFLLNKNGVQIYIYHVTKRGKMAYFILDLNTLKNNLYKMIFCYLCDTSDIIYLTFYEDLMINEKIFELGELCEQVNVSKKIRNKFDANVIGYKVDVMIERYIYEQENICNLLGDREYGGILFYQGETEVAYIQMTDFKDIYIRTNDKGLIKKLLAIEHNYHSGDLWDN